MELTTKMFVIAAIFQQNLFVDRNVMSLICARANQLVSYKAKFMEIEG